jgi:hypothetical protein
LTESRESKNRGGPVEAVVRIVVRVLGGRVVARQVLVG